jgi:DNA polymerase IV
MNKRIILHIDMNSYFASVEQQANPFLRGRSVGVCAYLSPGGTIIASSLEAKAKGIKTGCRVRDALVLDPQIVLLENEPAKYRSTTEKIFAIFKSFTDTVEPYSIDEAFLDMSGWIADWARAEAVAREIQVRINREVGEWLGASIGVSWTKFLAKFAGDIAPKKGILFIRNSRELEDSLFGRPLTDAWGINTRLEQRLRALDIHNLAELRAYSPDRIRHFLGRYGYYLWANVNGIEVSSVNRGSSEPKSIGHSYCLPKKTRDKKYLKPILYKLCEKTGRRLRANNREAHGINIYFAYTHGGGIGRSWRTKDSLFTSEEIFFEADGFLEKASLALPIRMLAVSVFCLTDVSRQLSMFEDKLGQKDLSLAVDKINDKYGEYTVVRGQMFGTDQAAKDRIGFRKTVVL